MGIAKPSTADMLDKHHNHLNQKSALTCSSSDFGVYLTKTQSGVVWKLSTEPHMYPRVATPLINAAALRWFTGSCVMAEALVRNCGASSCLQNVQSRTVDFRYALSFKKQRTTDGTEPRIVLMLLQISTIIT